MRILFLTQIVPFPPDAGPKVKTWHVLRYLAAQGHDITLVSYVRTEERRFLPELERVCSAVHAVPITRSRVRDVWYLLRSQVSGRPFLVERDDLRPMRTAVNDLLRTQSFDAVHCDQLTMALFALDAPPTFRGVRVFDAHNATWAITDRMRKTAALPLKPVLALETRRIKRFESRLIAQFEHTLAVTEIDKAALLQAVRESHSAEIAAQLAPKIRTVPITIDTERYRPVSAESGSHNIMTLGTLHYPPNADGIRWFATAVFPLIQQANPEATLTIVGKNPPADFVQMDAQNRAVTVTGYVPDLIPYLEKAAVLAVPVRAGGGMRVRILEAMAHQLPVVTTTIGLEGIDAVSGRDVLVADTPEAFAQAVTGLLDQPDTRAALALNGRRFVVDHYDWQTGLRGMDAIYGGRGV